MKKVIDNLKNLSKTRKIVLGILVIAFIAVCTFAIFNRNGGKFAIKEIIAKNEKNNIIANNTTFILKTANGSVKDVESHLYLEPALDYEVKKIGHEKYEVKLNGEISDNTVFNLAYVENEVPVYKWAFQTKQDLSVGSIYPHNEASYVDTKSAIEVVLSYPNVEGFEEHFSITPNVEGKFQNNGRKWTFIPNEPLKDNTEYVVKISSGLQVGDVVMANDFESKFATNKFEKLPDVSVNTISVDKIDTFKPTDNPTIQLSGKLTNELGIDNIEVFKYDNANDYIKYLNGKDVEAKSLGKYAYTTYAKEDLIVLTDKLPIGYYRVDINTKNRTLTSANIQVNDLAGYSLVTERDLLVWVAEGNDLKENVEIKFKDKSAKTNSDGLVTFKDINDFSKEINYILVGSDNPLVIGVKFREYKTQPRAYLYTDRLLYKTNDTINIWGYIPTEFFYENVNLKAFTINFDERNYPVEVSKEGIFQTKIELDNNVETSSGIYLYYNDELLASRYIDIENYMAKNYVYEIDIDKNYVKAGDSFEFDVKVKHVTNLNAIGKDIVVTYNKKEYQGVTNDLGIAHFRINTQKTTNKTMSNIVDSNLLEVRSAGVGYDNYETGMHIYELLSDINISSSVEDEQVIFNINYVDSNKKVKYDDIDSLNGLAYTNDITVNIYESKTVRSIKEYSYNEYTKESTPIYKYDNSKTIISTVPLSGVDGKYVYKYDSAALKKDTEDIYYSYYADLLIKDKNNNYIQSTQYFDYDNEYDEDASNNYLYRPAYSYVDSHDYNFYKYELNAKKHSYSIDDTIELSLNDINGILKNQGKLLEVFYKENIVNSDIKSSEDLNSRYTNRLYPGTNLTGSYFLDGKFYRLPSSYLDYDEKDSLLTIDIKLDKNSYKPQDTVKLDLNIKDKDGKNVDSILNVSVVNEAIFNMKEDTTDILETIYSDKYYESYTYSSSRDYVKNTVGGEGDDDGGGERSDFGDTIYFETVKANNGKATVEFKLNDEITTFRITVHAVTTDNKAGVNTANVTSTLPLSIASTAPRNLKNTDDVVINISSITNSNQSTKYSVTIKELDKTLETTGTNSEVASVNFGRLDVGTYNVVVNGVNGNNKDALTYPITVSESYHNVAIKKELALSNNITIKPAKNPIVLEIYNKNMARYLDYINLLEKNVNDRVDTMVTYYKAQELKNKYYELNRELEILDLSMYDYSGWIRPLPNAENDSILTGLINYYASNYVKTYPRIDIKDIYENKEIKELFVLASRKEPVLLDLHFFKKQKLNTEEKLLIALSYAFLGDYNNAKDIYKDINKKDLTDTLKDLYVILSTFVDKGSSEKEINKLVKEQKSSDYVNFAILSYLLNNNADITKKETVTITSGDINETVEINGLTIKKLTLFTKDLKDLRFKTKSKNIITSYYYQGKVDELDNVNKNIELNIKGNLAKNKTATLTIDISKLDKKDGLINIILPYSLRLSATINNQKGLYLMNNTLDNTTLSINKDFKGSVIELPVYMVNSGEFEIEPVIISNEGNYNISNSLKINIK